MFENLRVLKFKFSIFTQDGLIKVGEKIRDFHNIQDIRLFDLAGSIYQNIRAEAVLVSKNFFQSLFWGKFNNIFCINFQAN